jgi:multidrug efflux system membrane fusion protein
MLTPRSFALWIAVFLSFALGACSRVEPPPTKASGPGPAVPVAVAPVVQRTIPIQVRAIGTVEPYSTINVKAEMSGQLQKVYFSEGDMVEKGQKLFQVDPRPQQETIRQLEANLAKDAAQARNAEAEAARYAELARQGVVARQQSEQYQAAAAAWQATLDADRAAIQNARLQLQYTTTFAPITGRTGNLLIKEGNIVKANDLPLVTIHQIEPIYATFSVPEKELPEIRARFASGLTVQATPSGDSHAATGKLTFIDNAVDPATGTIKMKATFQNKDHRLWPGQFVDIVLTVMMQPNAILVPSQAVQAGQNGQYVFVVGQDGIAQYRAVSVGRSAGDNIVVAGVNPGERVVTDGQSKLVPGARVQIVNRAPAPMDAQAGGPGGPGL